MTNISINLKKAYIFTTNQGKKIEIEAYFKEEAIIIFQEKHQRIGPKYYHPVVFTEIEILNNTKRKIEKAKKIGDEAKKSIDILTKAIKKATEKQL